MRKVSRSGKAEATASFNRFALGRSVPNGFSTMSRDQAPGLAWLRPLVCKFSRMMSNSVGDEAR